MSLKQRKIKIKPRIKLNHNIYIGSKCVTALIIQFSFCHFFVFYFFFFAPFHSLTGHFLQVSIAVLF